MLHAGRFQSVIKSQASCCKAATLTLKCCFIIDSSTNTHTHTHAFLLFVHPLFSLQFFHFSSRAFPPLDGQFTGRIQWQGSPARGDASIALINSTLQDNGTYTCSVRNPPDVHGSPTSHTVLTVTPKGGWNLWTDVTKQFHFFLSARFANCSLSC